MPTILINPLDETPRHRGHAAPRLDTLAGKTVALLDIGKPGGSVFLDRIEVVLKDEYRVERVVRTMKPTFTKPAPDELIQQLLLERVHAVVEALAD